jgi:hypothetical protein
MSGVEAPSRPSVRLCEAMRHSEIYVFSNYRQQHSEPKAE